MNEKEYAYYTDLENTILQLKKLRLTIDDADMKKGIQKLEIWCEIKKVELQSGLKIKRKSFLGLFPRYDVKK